MQLLSTPSIQTQQEMGNNSPQRNVRVRIFYIINPHTMY